MQVQYADLPGIILLEPRFYADARGFFFESYNAGAIASAGITDSFVQDNHSGSRRGVLRGIHYQVKNPQAKLVRVISGEIFDVAVDVRKSSATFGRWFGTRLSSSNKLQMYIPSGFAHAFLALSDWAEVLYKASDFYAPEHERCILWNDPDLAIDWPLETGPILSAKDAQGSSFREADLPFDAGLSLK